MDSEFNNDVSTPIKSLNLYPLYNIFINRVFTFNI